MATLQEFHLSKEFNVLEKFPKVTGKNRMDLLTGEIDKFLYDKIHEGVERLYYIEVEGHHRKIFQPYDDEAELGLHGGQISIFSYNTKARDEGIVTGVNRTGIKEQADWFWEIMEFEKGHIDVHFVHYEGPWQRDARPFSNREVYDGHEMTAYRIRFKLQRKPSSSIVQLYGLKIIKESWNRTTKKQLI